MMLNEDTYHAASVNVYTLDGGNIVHLGSFGSFGSTFFTVGAGEDNMISSGGVFHGSLYSSKYYIDGTEAIQLCTYSVEYLTETDLYLLTEMKINDQDVTPEQWEQYFGQTEYNAVYYSDYRFVMTEENVNLLLNDPYAVVLDISKVKEFDTHYMSLPEYDCIGDLSDY